MRLAFSSACPAEVILYHWWADKRPLDSSAENFSFLLIRLSCNFKIKVQEAPVLTVCLKSFTADNSQLKSSLIAHRLLARKELETLVAGGLGGPPPLERIGTPDNVQANRPLSSWIEGTGIPRHKDFWIPLSACFWEGPNIQPEKAKWPSSKFKMKWGTPPPLFCFHVSLLNPVTAICSNYC